MGDSVELAKAGLMEHKSEGTGFEPHFIIDLFFLCWRYSKCSHLFSI